MAGLNTIRGKILKSKPRVGRGGKRGKTSGRGTKGQKARAGHSIRPEMRDFIKRFPKLRGHGIHRARSVNSSNIKPLPVNLATINDKYENGEEVSIDSLLEKGIVSLRSGKKPAVKILAKGAIEKKVTIVGLPVSESVKKAIEKAGGQIK